LGIIRGLCAMAIRAVHVVRELLANLAMSLPVVRGWRVRRGRTACWNAEDQVALFLSQSRMFVEPVGEAAVRGRVVVEVGPGDVIPHGLLFLGMGAARYVAIDRFLGDVFAPAALKLYEAVLARAPAGIRDGLRERGLHPASEAALRRACATGQIVLLREPIESPRLAALDPADLIVSSNAVQHFADIDRAFANMARLLRPDGLMMLRVDYGALGCWTEYENPLTFLTVSNGLWRLMGGARGYPNRRRHSQVIAALRRCGLEPEVRRVTHFYPEHLRQIRPALVDEFRALADDDLLVRDAEIVLRRSG